MSNQILQNFGDKKLRCNASLPRSLLRTNKDLTEFGIVFIAEVYANYLISELIKSAFGMSSTNENGNFCISQ